MDLKDLMQNPYAWAVLSLCTVISVLFAIWVYFKGKKRIEISYYTTTTEIVRDGKYITPNLRVSYRDETINNLTATRYAIWNSGTEVINHSDVVSLVPLQIVSEDNNVNILDAIIIKQSEETNMFNIAEKAHQYVRFDFDYVDKQDGIVVQVLHTGTAASLKLDCKIKGGEKPKNVNANYTESFSKEQSKKVGAVMFIIMCVFLAVIILAFVFVLLLKDSGLIPSTLIEMIFQTPNKDDSIKLSVLLISMLLAVVMEARLIVRDAFYTRIPSKLRDGVIGEDIGPNLNLRQKMWAVLQIFFRS